jgi:hypothetical protein
MSVCCECYVFTGNVLYVGLNILSEDSHRICGMSDCDRETLMTRRPWPTKSCCVVRKKKPHQTTTSTLPSSMRDFRNYCELEFELS